MKRTLDWDKYLETSARAVSGGIVMLKNDGGEDAWSMDQESVDLNAYLALECKLLKKFSGLMLSLIHISETTRH